MDQIERACQCVVNGGVIAYPTEAVFGLGCDPLNTTALENLLSIKGRGSHKGFIVVCSSTDQLSQYIKPLTPELSKRVREDWPGPVTWILPAAEGLPALLTGQRDTIAIRLSAHPTIKALCDRLNHPLVSSSANPSGQTALRTALDVKNTFGNRLDYIIDAPVGDQENPSAIFDGLTMEQLR